MAYKIYTDSSADLSNEIINRYNISVIPLSVIFEDKEYLDLTPAEFYKKLGESENLPTTSQVPPERFIEAFSKEIKKGNKIIFISIGSNASGTFQSAVIAKETLGNDDIYLIDSNSLCLGTGMIAIRAAEMLENNNTIEEIIEMAKYYSDNNIEHLFCVDTLKYLKKGGRIKASKAMIAEVLNIKPVLTVEDAITVLQDKVRGRNKIISYFILHMKNTIDLEKTNRILVGHAMDIAFAQKLEKAIYEELNFQGEILISEIGPIIGTHSGPGILAVFYIKKLIK